MRKTLKHETRILLLTLLSGAPAVVLSIGLLWLNDFSNGTRWVLAVLLVAVWWGLAEVVRDRVVRPFQTASNLLSALREKDFSVRARTPRRDDALPRLTFLIAQRAAQIGHHQQLMGTAFLAK